MAQPQRRMASKNGTCRQQEGNDNPSKKEYAVTQAKFRKVDSSSTWTCKSCQMDESEMPWEYCVAG
jgi:hypothetical protein